MYVVLVYDVSQQENGSKRWSRIFKICKRYLTHIQILFLKVKFLRLSWHSYNRNLSSV